MATWYPRTTDGYPSWFTLEGDLTQVERDLTAVWNLATTVEADFAATYSIDVAASDITWFPLLTDGFNTWAGQALVGGMAGSINGSDTLPITVEEAFVALYSVGLTATRDLTATWSIRNEVQQDFTATWSSKAQVSGDLVATWSVAEGYVQVTADLAAVYELLGTVERDVSAFWGISAALEQDLVAVWQLTDAVSQDFLAEWQVLTVPLSAGNDLVGAWGIWNDASNDLVATFSVSNEVASASDLTAEWDILDPVEADFEALWQRLTVAQTSFTAIYQITGIYLRRRMRATIDGHAMSAVLLDPEQATAVQGNEMRVT
jgi:hypothetical protein